MHRHDVCSIRLLSDAAATKTSQWGGKGATLSRLLQEGLAVPVGCVLSFAVLTDVLHTQNLRTSGSAEEARQAVLHSTLPPDIQSELHTVLSRLGAAPHGWAVRSSALTEDSYHASYAGVYESVLGVQEDDLWAAIQTCWASWWAPRALVYRQHLGDLDTVPAMGIVIQKMVPAQHAGVAFTADPLSGDPSRIVINVAAGPGHVVVAGVVEPEQYVLAKTPELHLLETHALRPDQAPLLSSDALLTLGQLLMQIEACCDGPQDVEWVWDGTQWWIVQSRPITTLNETTLGSAPDTWGNANLKDVLPGIVSPLMWTQLSPQIEAAFRAQHAQYGYTLDPARPLIRRFWGRLYFNLSVLEKSGYDLFAVTPQEQVVMRGGAESLEEMDTPPPRFGQRLSWLQNFWRFNRLTARASREASHQFTAMRREWRDNIRDIPDLERAALLDKFAQDLSNPSPFLLLHLHLSWAASGAMTQLQKWMMHTRPENGASITADLVTGLGDVSSAEQSYRLWELSRLARQSPRVMDFLEQGDWQSWRQALAKTPFLKAWQAFLDTYGHRAVYELEIANPRWREQPAYLFDILTQYTRLSQDTPPFDPQIQTHRRQSAEREVRRHLPMWQRLPFQMLLRRTQTLCRLRENSKFHLVLGSDWGRLLALTVGRLLVKEGCLAACDDVFFLEQDEVVATLRGDLSPTAVQQLITQRRLIRQRDAARQPPDLIIGERPVYSEVFSAQETILSGLPSSPGRVTGIARILRSPYEGHRLRPGEILVAPSTDPGWTPLFLLASGLVVETGGYLSHGSIVAREYGIPAVLNVPLATQRIPDGGIICLDGGQGTVQCHIAATEICPNPTSKREQQTAYTEGL